MPSSLYTTLGRNHTASQVLEALDESSSSYLYLFIGDIPRSNNEVLDFANTYENDYEVWSRIHALKRVVESDVAFVVPRYDWEEDSIYEPYRVDLANVESSYVLTDDWNVYLCVSNNDGEASTEKPTTTGTNIEDTADGYRWKYLYSIAAGQREKFLTSTWMPVFQDTDVVEAAVHGGVHHIDILETGEFTQEGEFTILIEGDGTGFEGLANVQASGDTFAIDFVTVIEPGEGYHFSNNCYVNADSSIQPTLANLVAVIEPTGGWGSDPANHLRAKKLMVAVDLVGGEASNALNQFFLTDPIEDHTAYRFFGLIVDPRDRSLDSLARVGTYNACHVLEYSSSSGTVETGTVLEQDDVVFLVVWNDTTNSRVFASRFNDWQNLDTLTTGVCTQYPSGSASITVSSVDQPDLEFGSGRIIYKYNLDTPLHRLEDQQETIRFILSF